MKTKKNIKIVLIALLLAGAVAGFGYGMTAAAKTGEAQATTMAAVSAGSPMVPGNFSDLAEKVRAGVVNIQVSKKVKNARFERFEGNPFGDRNPFGDFFGPFGGPGNNAPERRQQGVGSGFIMSKEGYILTNNHVVEDADQIKVKLAGGKEFDGKIVGRDPKTDLALVKIAGDDLQPLKLGNSDELKVGNWVVAVGSPFGLEQTVTAGIVSAKGRVIGSGPYDNFIQTDASINPGNSGGPLINLQGEVVGINTAIIASGQGIGFAIPINMAKEIAPQLQKRGHVTRGLLGVSIQDVTPELAKSLGLKDSKGALVSQVVPGGPAEKAGLEQGDVIVNFDGRPVDNSKDLPRIVASTPVGKTVTVKLLRDGKEVERQTKVGEMEEENTSAAAKSPIHPSLGVTVQDWSPQIARELGLKKSAGVVVTGVEPGSPAAEAMIQVGDVIQTVDRKPVKDVDDFVKIVEKAKGGGSLLLLVQRGQNSMFAAVTPR
ncbi:MAG: DegQ family serine endoprotease [Deltaproteobacteria bacterium]|nr:DegQ family serine endoprotease [Deltaproteobacteria bacterium]